jgi:ABC-type uncharacterized transport system fused permease/ATPase subunit
MQRAGYVLYRALVIIILGVIIQLLGSAHNRIEYQIENQNSSYRTKLIALDENINFMM